jgi:hypothetical protein
VQSGGNFEVDYTVMDPDDKVLLEGVNERQGDFIFTANKVGWVPSVSGNEHGQLLQSYTARRVRLHCLCSCIGTKLTM